MTFLSVLRASAICRIRRQIHCKSLSCATALRAEDRLGWDTTASECGGCAIWAIDEAFVGLAFVKRFTQDARFHPGAFILAVSAFAAFHTMQG